MYMRFGLSCRRLFTRVNDSACKECTERMPHAGGTLASLASHTPTLSGLLKIKPELSSVMIRKTVLLLV